MLLPAQNFPGPSIPLGMGPIRPCPLPSLPTSPCGPSRLPSLTGLSVVLEYPNCIPATEPLCLLVPAPGTRPPAPQISDQELPPPTRPP